MENTFYFDGNTERLRLLPANSVDTIITDSPYGLGKKQNIHLLLMAWLTVGFYAVKGKGIVGKVWDAFVPQPALWKECYRVLKPGGHLLSFFGTRTYHLGALAVELSGFEVRDMISWIYGTGFLKSNAQLKPATEPILVAVKPGPLKRLHCADTALPSGRLCPNVMVDDHIASILDALGNRKSGRGRKTEGNAKRCYISSSGSASISGARSGGNITQDIYYDAERNEHYSLSKAYGDDGGASRFFYIAKPSPSERTLPGGTKNSHPTVKPVKLMEQLVKLYCPPGGTVLDPHAGSGTTGVACENTGRHCILIDNCPDSADIIKKRLPYFKFISS